MAEDACLRNEIEQVAIDCAMQHIKIYREQVLRKVVADFGEPCESCIYSAKCDFQWVNKILPLLSKSNVTINLADLEMRDKQGNGHSYPEQDKDILHNNCKNTPSACSQV